MTSPEPARPLQLVTFRTLAGTWSGLVLCSEHRQRLYRALADVGLPGGHADPLQPHEARRARCDTCRRHGARPPGEGSR